MRVLFVHDRFGPMAGAEVNIWLTAGELKQRGHVVGILHGPSTGNAETEWRELFEGCFALGNPDEADAVRAAMAAFQPDIIYVHKMSDLAVLEGLLQSALPVVR